MAITTGNDIVTISVPSKSITYDGLSGIDTARIKVDSSGFKISTSQDKTTFKVKVAVHVISGASSPPTITLKNFEKIQFNDVIVQLLTVIDDGSGNYTASGTSSKDSITTGTGNDTITGDAGDDTINARGGNNAIDAGTGNDKISAGAATDIVANFDTITAGAGNDKVTVVGLAGSTIYGDGVVEASTDGKDIIKTGNGNNTIYGNGGNDIITTGSGDDNIHGGTGKDTIHAGGGNNIIDGGAGDDVIFAGAATDTSATADQITGGAGADKITVTGAANATVWGDDSAGETITDGNDVIKTGNGNDIVYGGGGADIISTGKGNDFLAGGTGSDKLTGGAGADIFCFDTALNTVNPANLAKPGATDNVDFITDFKPVDGDIIQLNHAIFGSLSVGTLGSLVSAVSPVANTPTDYILYDSKSGALYYDADGSGSASGAVEIAILTGHPVISASDIHII